MCVRNPFVDDGKSKWKYYTFCIHPPSHRLYSSTYFHWNGTCCFNNTRFFYLFYRRRSFSVEIIIFEKIKANMIIPLLCGFFWINKNAMRTVRTYSSILLLLLLLFARCVSIIQSFLPIYRKCLLELSSCIFFESFNF